MPNIEDIKEKLTEAEYCHLTKVAYCHTLESFQRTIDIQAVNKRNSGLTECLDCKSIAQKLGMTPIGGWIMETHFCKDCKHCLLAEDTKESRCLVTPKETTFFVDGKRYRPSIGGPEQYHYCTEVRTNQHCSQFDPIGE